MVAVTERHHLDSWEYASLAGGMFVVGGGPCVYMLWSVWQLPRQIRARIFLRQLFAMMLCELLLNVTLGFSFLHQSLCTSSHVTRTVCRMINVILFASVSCSEFVECSLAVGLALAAVRNKRMLSAVDYYWSRLAWAVSFSWAVLVSYTEGPGALHQEGKCTRCGFDQPDGPTLPILAVWIILQTVICVVCYVLILGHACLRASRPVIRRAIVLNSLYILVGVVRNVMLFLFVFTGDQWAMDQQNIYLALGTAPFSLGFVILYGNQSRHLRTRATSMGHSGEEARRCSFSAATPAPTDASKPKDVTLASFSVAFEFDPSIFFIPADGGEVQRAVEVNLSRLYPQELAHIGSTTNEEPEAEPSQRSGPSNPERVIAAYQIVKDVWLRESPSVSSGRVACLNIGSRVEVVQIKSEEQRIWARLKEPVGWITVQTLDNGIDWATLVPMF